MTVGSIATGTTRVEAAIQLASQRTGVDFGYLLGQARVESGLRPDARASTSSASGLFQFVDQSWLGVVKQHGAVHGLGWAAGAIRQGANGRFSVDPTLRQAVMNLRNDATAASLMAGAHAADNKAALEGHLGREVGGTDLYMAHFLGLGGAKRFLTRMADAPGQSAAALFPAAAAANRNVFYTPAGQPRSLAQVYDRFAEKIGGAGAGAASVPAATGNALPAIADVLPAEFTSTLQQLGASAGMDAEALMRPRPDNARLAYMMLASMGA
ncbi:hypothetical protein GGR88_002269 [Sphingomonas jejuensis]|uniref:Lytic transglycosylase domain-containing protein n=1 Tax=Sphingomonas jejuensis TaxID=904715 RepID=A0ABX0XNE9_9SPHN|nr:lytic transglycosylase domain-containing protein [Sphingomonas jejuensis]NJC34755.1 hypothetical protein [Sphingomonas jejuensis]